MKRFIATLLCTILCVQPVFAQEISQKKEETTQVIQDTEETTGETAGEKQVPPVRQSSVFLQQQRRGNRLMPISTDYKEK